MFHYDIDVTKRCQYIYPALPCEDRAFGKFLIALFPIFDILLHTAMFEFVYLFLILIQLSTNYHRETRINSTG